MADAESVTAASREFFKMADHLDVLVNNAGVLFDSAAAILEVEMRGRPQDTRDEHARPAPGHAGVCAAAREKQRAANHQHLQRRRAIADGADGWAPSYCISKTALNGVTSQLAAALPKCTVNSVCPGWVRTDMGGAGVPRSAEEGADTIVWLATDAPQTLTGQFLCDRQEIAW